MVTYEELKSNRSVRAYIKAADESLAALGYTEHHMAHVVSVAERAASILECLDYDDHTVELAKIAGLLHDIGNMVNRVSHSQSGAIIAYRLLEDLKMDPEDIATVVTAIGNHDEGNGIPVSDVAAALIIADKSDVRRSRVRFKDGSRDYDIHDRVNGSVTSSTLAVNDSRDKITLTLDIDTDKSSVMEYFEIFLERMLLCRKAAERLGLVFSLVVNGTTLI